MPLNNYTNMRKLSFILMLIAIGVFSCSVCTEDIAVGNKGKLFIIGGGHRSDALMSRMIDEAGVIDSGYVVILPMSSEMPDSAIVWASSQFRKLGVNNIIGFNFPINEEIPNLQWIDSLKNASLIYISGGDQNRFMSIVGESEIAEAINYAYANGAMIAGTSAGAAVMSESMITGNELRNAEYSPTFRVVEIDNIELSKGLGLMKSVIVDQHFVKRSRYNRLLSAVIENPDIIGIGIDEATAILVCGNEVEVVGKSQVIVFNNPEKSKIVKDGKLGARNLRIDIYLPGDIFRIED
jgi:cyanophycinase